MSTIGGPKPKEPDVPPPPTQLGKQAVTPGAGPTEKIDLVAQKGLSQKNEPVPTTETTPVFSKETYLSLDKEISDREKALQSKPGGSVWAKAAKTAASRVMVALGKQVGTHAESFIMQHIEDLYKNHKDDLKKVLEANFLMVFNNVADKIQPLQAKKNWQLNLGKEIFESVVGELAFIGLKESPEAFQAKARDALIPQLLAVALPNGANDIILPESLKYAEIGIYELIEETALPLAFKEIYKVATSDDARDDIVLTMLQSTHNLLRSDNVTEAVQKMLDSTMELFHGGPLPSSSKALQTAPATEQEKTFCKDFAKCIVSFLKQCDPSLAKYINIFDIEGKIRDNALPMARLFQTINPMGMITDVLDKAFAVTQAPTPTKTTTKTQEIDKLIKELPEDVVVGLKNVAAERWKGPQAKEFQTTSNPFKLFYLHACVLQCSIIRALCRLLFPATAIKQKIQKVAEKVQKTPVSEAVRSLTTMIKKPPPKK